MKLKNRYFILRHGETIYQTRNKNIIYPPQPENPPIKLTKRGENQIKQKIKLLKKLKIDLFFSSDFFRTKQTSEIVAEKLGIKINFDKRLRDINLGIYHSGPKENYYKKISRFSKNDFYYRPPKGESWKDCRKRVLNFLKEIEKKYNNKNILVVSHGDPLWLFEGLVRNWSLERLLKIKKNGKTIKTGELRIIV